MVVVKYGEALHRELEPLVDAGLSNEEALRAATILAVEWFRSGNRAAIAVWKRADMVLIGGNLVDDIADNINVERVWIAVGESRWGEKII